MRYVRYAVWGALAAVLVSMSLANREPLTLSLMPEPLADYVGWNFVVTQPVFVVILASVGVGLLVGFILEWLRETDHRRAASQKAREVQKLEREVSRLKTEKNKDKDEVLALLEDVA
ncbi:MAG: lipopolysaccharide assembly protein LapA domain-containing protein [Marinibacterium sp.]